MTKLDKFGIPPHFLHFLRPSAKMPGPPAIATPTGLAPKWMPKPPGAGSGTWRAFAGTTGRYVAHKAQDTHLGRPATKNNKMTKI